MRVVAVANGGGSAGKTTTVVTLATSLAMAGRSVVVVDLDPQGNASQALGVDTEDPGTSSTGDVLLHLASLAEILVESSIHEAVAKAGGRLRVAPARTGGADPLSTAAARLPQVKGQGVAQIGLGLAELTDVDVVFIDCPGTLGLLVDAGLVASTHVITVTQPTLKELRGIEVIRDEVAGVVTAYPRPSYTAGAGLAVEAIVPCMVPPASAGKAYAEALTLLDDTYGDLVTPPVRRSVRVPEAFAQAVPLPLFSRTDPVTKDYALVEADLVKRGVL